MSSGKRSESTPGRAYTTSVPSAGSRGAVELGLRGVLRIGRRLRGRVPAPVRGPAPLPVPGSDPQPDSLSDWQRIIVEEARPYTMTSRERLVATIDAVDYLLLRNVPGALVECGVWKGGSVLAMIRTLQNKGVDDRDIYLFDTFEGMTRPTERDTSNFDAPALDTWESSERAGSVPWGWAFDPEIFNFDTVRSLILNTGYPERRIHLVKGRVEDTLPGAAPPSIALLRLDTDWYDSTWHELIHLYPRISGSGVLIIDDYGHWDGCRMAVDAYFRKVQTPILLSRIDYTGRLGVKVP